MRLIYRGLDNSLFGGIFLVMNTNRFIRLSTLLVTIMLAIALTNSVQAKSARSTMATSSSNSITLLHEVLSTLAQADHDYKGHRAEAMKQIHLALGVHAGGHAVTSVHHSANKHSGKGNETQANSDAQLRHAQGLLQQASSEVSGAVLQHVNAAIAQLNTALSIR